MTSKFHQQIQTSLSNQTLQVALDSNAERRRNARSQAYASLPVTLEAMRQRAHAVRAATIADLDRYLEQFIHQAQQNGIEVHRAKTASEAVQTVLEITQSCQANLIAKSKTMVGEEIHLNPALEAAGLRVVETDLGEYIVQLREEPPSHIITPAVHLTRADVGKTFQDKLGTPYSEDIPTLTSVARKVLRDTFLSADVGISGVNFGVAESGAICLLTNEGNGRMITTLPKVHIALMGIERIVPTYDDLALMLYLLARSATGQKLTVYTTLVRSPKQPGETDGPQQRHVILVDNGRRAVRSSELAEILYCIRCGACLNACPVFREIGGHAYLGTSGRGTPYPGPVGSVVTPALFGASEFGNLAHASSLCGACKEACPVDIDLPRLLLRVRAAGFEPKTSDSGSPPQATKPWGHIPSWLRLALRLYGWTASSTWRFAAAQRAAGLLSRLASPFSEFMHLPDFSGWGFGRDFPRPAVRPFRAQFSGIQQEPATSPAPTEKTASSAEGHPSPQTPGTQDLARRFAAELENLGGQAVRCPESQLPALLLGLLRELGVTRLQTWEKRWLPAGLLESLSAAGISLQTDPDPTIKAGLTGALAGIAETGSLVLTGAPGCPLTASLLPETHIAVLRVGDICENLAQAFHLAQVQAASSTVIISGPSRTADIEMTLTIGVHGPSQLHVFCLE